MAFVQRLSFCFLSFLFLCMQACTPSRQSQALEKIKKEYKAEDVTFHVIKEMQDGKEKEVLEIILINSLVLKASKNDFFDCILIARTFYTSFDANNPYVGVRVVISNKDDSSETLGFLKDYYYNKAVLDL